ncbi:MAG TPA: CocE/NonD family hydrolase [Flavobacteriales bacterium]|nr:CocE/NonD family hydrolase [Flavobacteriales bacterium]
MRFNLLFTCLIVTAGFTANAQVDSTYIKKLYDKVEYMIPMRDGIKLYTCAFIPKDKSKKYPILLNRTPYSCQPYGKNAYWQMIGPGYSKKYIDEGFIFVKQDVRGRFMSEGEFMDVRPFNPKKTGNQTDEASDTYDAVDWMIKNIKECNGNVGVYGISYPGFYATLAALSYHPAIKAVSPQAPVTNWFLGDDVHHNGAFFLFDTFHFDYVFGKSRPKPTTVWDKGFQWPMPDAYKFFLQEGTLDNLTKKYMTDHKFWHEEMNHPNYDQFWKDRDIRQHLSGIKCAMLTVGGLYDAEDCWGAFETYKWIEAKSPGIDNKLIEGPWFHGGWSRSTGNYFGDIKFGSNTSDYYVDNIEFPFFMQHLKGGPDANLAEATLFDIGADKWRTYDHWPPDFASKKKMYMHNNGMLLFVEPKAITSYSFFMSDPGNPVPFTNEITNKRSREYMIEDQRFADQRPDVLTWTTPELKLDVTMLGEITADLWVNVTGTDADFIVKIIDVYPDSCKNYTLNGKEVKIGGYEMLVRAEVMRSKYRKSFETPEAMPKGKTEEVKFKIPDVMHTFKKGHKIMVQIQSTWFPLVDRNPQTFTDIYHCKESDFTVQRHMIIQEQGHASCIEINIQE